MRIGPFGPGDLVASTIGSVDVGSFVIGRGGLYFKAAWPATGMSAASEVMIHFHPPGTKGAPLIEEQWHPSVECMWIKGVRLEASLAGFGAGSSQNCLGVHTSGSVAIAVRAPDGNWFPVDLGSTGAVMTSRSAQGYIWSDSWLLELVLGSGGGRLVLGESP